MKLLFDENLSHRLSERLGDMFPGSTHVRNVGLKASDDPDVWKYAAANDFVIVSKDVDMHDRSLLFGFPPKVILDSARKLLDKRGRESYPKGDRTY